jgi:hypothetical protein
MARMRYRFPLLLLVGAISSIVIGWLIWHSMLPNPNHSLSPAAKKASAQLRDLLISATSLEILHAGDAMLLRAKSFQGAALERLAEAATIKEVNLADDGTYTVVENANIRFRLMKGDDELVEYWFLFPDVLVGTSEDSPRLYMSPSFADSLLRELTTTDWE